MGKQFIRIDHDIQSSNSFLMVLDARSKKYEKLPLTHNISFIKESKRICIGSYDLKTHREQHCPTFCDLSNTNYSRCKQCEILTGFSDCVRCNGLSCHTNVKKAIDYCNQDHVVYLAYFPDGIVKVGTSHFRRKETRILEQGAVAAIFICQGDGKITREIEYYIGNTGLKTRISTDYKLNHLIIDRTEKEIKNILMRTRKNLLVDVLDPYTKYLTEPVFYSQYAKFDTIKCVLDESQGQLTMDFFDRSYVNQEYKLYKNFQTIKGSIVSCIGSVLVVRGENGISAYDLSKAKGNVIQFASSAI